MQVGPPSVGGVQQAVGFDVADNAHVQVRGQAGDAAIEAANPFAEGV